MQQADTQTQRIPIDSVNISQILIFQNQSNQTPFVSNNLPYIQAQSDVNPCMINTKLEYTQVSTN